MNDKTDIVDELNQGWTASETKDARFVTVLTSEWIRCTDLTRRAAMEIRLLRQRIEDLKEANHNNTVHRRTDGE